MYRFDNSTESVYVLDKNRHAYEYIGTYIAYGITARMTERRKCRKVEEAILSKLNVEFSSKTSPNDSGSIF